MTSCRFALKSVAGSQLFQVASLARWSSAQISSLTPASLSSGCAPMSPGISLAISAWPFFTCCARVLRIAKIDSEPQELPKSQQILRPSMVSKRGRTLFKPRFSWVLGSGIWVGKFSQGKLDMLGGALACRASSIFATAGCTSVICSVFSRPVKKRNR